MWNLSTCFHVENPKSIFQPSFNKSMCEPWPVWVVSTAHLNQHIFSDYQKGHTLEFLGIAQDGLEFKFPVTERLVFEWHLHVRGS